MNVDIVKELLEINQLLNLWNTLKPFSGIYDLTDGDDFNDIITKELDKKIHLLLNDYREKEQK